MGTSSVERVPGAAWRHWPKGQVLSVKGVSWQAPDAGQAYWPAEQPELVLHDGTLLHWAEQ